MVAVSHRLQTVYFPTPKVACTSLKEFIYRLDTGREPGELRNRLGEPMSIHHVYGSNPNGGRWSRISRCYWSFVVVRDPVDRFVSGYRNRICFHRDLEREGARRLRWLGLPALPDFDAFVRGFPLYVRFSPAVKHHFRPQADYVGAVVEGVDRVYGIEELPSLEKELQARGGVDISMRREQTGGGEFTVTVESWHRRRIRAYMHADYAMLARLGRLQEEDDPPSAHGAGMLRRLGGLRG